MNARILQFGALALWLVSVGSGCAETTVPVSKSVCTPDRSEFKLPGVFNSVTIKSCTLDLSLDSTGVIAKHSVTFSYLDLTTRRNAEGMIRIEADGVRGGDKNTTVGKLGLFDYRPLGSPTQGYPFGWAQLELNGERMIAEPRGSFTMSAEPYKGDVANFNWLLRAEFKSATRGLLALEGSLEVAGDALPPREQAAYWGQSTDNASVGFGCADNGKSCESDTNTIAAKAACANGTMAACYCAAMAIARCFYDKGCYAEAGAPTMTTSADLKGLCKSNQDSYQSLQSNMQGISGGPPPFTCTVRCP